jgi:hypothetical protein
MAERPIPPMLLVRLKSRGPHGVMVGESRRVCHLVPLPQGNDAPEVLRAYCGQEIAQGTAELLDGMSGMPCEPCLARSPIPAFAMLRLAWGNLGLPPNQKLAAHFALLLLLHDPSRLVSVSEIAVLLEQDPQTIHLIMLLHTAVGWIDLPSEQADRPWTERCYRLTEHGTHLARQLGLNPTDVSTPDTLDPSGGGVPPFTAPTGLQPDEEEQ